MHSRTLAALAVATPLAVLVWATATAPDRFHVSECPGCGHEVRTPSDLATECPDCGTLA